MISRSSRHLRDRNQIPPGGYWRTAGQVFGYPLVTVFARSKAEADAIAQYGTELHEQMAYLELAMDSADAQVRLGIHGRPDLLARIMRGD